MKLVDAANGLYTLLGMPSNVSIASICAFYRQNIGDLNNLLSTSYAVNNTSLEIVDENNIEITNKEISIFNLLFEIRYYTRESRNFMGVGGVDNVVSVESDNGRITFANRNTSAQLYIQLRKDANEQLNKLLNLYKFNRSRPNSVDGDDTNVEITSNRLGSNTIVSSRGGGISNNTTP